MNRIVPGSNARSNNFMLDGRNIGDYAAGNFRQNAQARQGMNTLSFERQRDIIHLLAEGNSLRSASRLTDTHRDTIARLLVKTGEGCRAFLDGKLVGLKLRHIQSDEIWTFVHKKQAMVRADECDYAVGDQYLWIAFDTDTKLIATYALGKRTSEVAEAFMQDLAGRVVTECPQISTDGWQGYPRAIW